MSCSERVDLTIIIVNYNTEELVCDCIESIPRGITTHSYRVVVVDNGSSDNSVKAIKSRFAGVEIIENGVNLGFAAANNLALQRANSSYYLLLNSDTILTEHSLDTVIEFMREHPECGFASPQLLNADGSLQNTAANFPSLITELGNKSLLRALCPQKYYKKKFVSEVPLAVESLVGASLFAKAEMCGEIGFYDDSFFFFLEETEWCRRGSRAGWKSYLIPQAKIYHLQGQTAKKVPIRVRIEYWRSRYRYFKESYSYSTYIILMTGLLIKNAANLLLNLPASPFSVKSRHKLELSLCIFKWHLLGCPKGMGLSVT